MTATYDAAYQGTRGANSEDACIDLLSAEAKLLPCDTLEDVFNAVSRGVAQYGVVPVENSLAGSIIKSTARMRCLGVTDTRRMYCRRRAPIKPHLTDFQSWVRT